ncbi:PIN domain nuclease [Phototrophicus methaneseepsis]|uniref:PIN domain nuclease n=1 Tax=Phototrophicus methaneseepsis TaxID=2710758 RepID=A0A7S8E9P6_9CHLR|nr:PIN domain nuclease [Phototrophicus methaneseepsis]QPC82975.1 PIN domain nuclease [Phototrophicus methaneseepsis]
MTLEFLSRLAGLVIFGIIGARFGAQESIYSSLNLTQEASANVMGLTGMLFGLLLTPRFTVQPVQALRKNINEMPADQLLMSLIGLAVGLVLALLAAYPLSLLPVPLNWVVPAAITVVGAYLGLNIFVRRGREIQEELGKRMLRSAARPAGTGARKLLVDTSSLIDGRIVDVAETGFVGGTLIIPRFVLTELHQVADSPDPLRRNRGRRGLNLLNKLQRSELVLVRIVDDDFEDIAEVDDKLVALAQQMSASLITNDYNLGEVADAQGVPVLNINKLSNAVRSIYIPGETFAIRVIQEGREENQGVGYLDDGTMVLIENGKAYLDRNIQVEVTKLINRDTGRIIFASPAS